jgi:type I site-specific restriction endonuclease
MSEQQEESQVNTDGNAESKSTDEQEQVTEQQSDEQQQVSEDAATEESDQQEGEESSSDEVTESYELKAPDDSQLSDDDLAKISETAKELKLTNEQAQKLVDMQADAESAFQQKADENWKQLTESWVEEVKADKDLGGDNFTQTMQDAGKAVEKFATPEFKEALESSGYGNHPELVRVFARIGKAMGEDNPIGGQANQGGERSTADVLYPNMKKQGD